MLSKIPQEYLKFLSVKDLETLLDLKRRDEADPYTHLQLPTN